MLQMTASMTDVNMKVDFDLHTPFPLEIPVNSA